VATPLRLPRAGSGAPPLIAVSTSEVRETTALTAPRHGEPPRREMVLGLTYLRALERAGALPVVVPPLGPDAVASIVERVDGICLSGGPDLHPSAYGAPADAELGPTEPALDAFELALARAADERGLPILAICRGLQVLNVARGGTLYQHLPTDVGEAITHRQDAPGDRATHWVTVAPHSELARLLGQGRVKVNSFHHQAARTIGHGLSPVAWAADGTVEGLEAGGERFVLGVQWHTELLTARRPHRNLFEAFARACADEGRFASTCVASPAS
jgi:putative glutamine amidotransferase